MTFETFDQFFQAFEGIRKEETPDGNSLIYKVHLKEWDEAKIVAVVSLHSHPLQLTLKCDPLLAKNLREKYETVLPAHQLNKKEWNTIICSGQLSDDEIYDLARLSYRLVTE